MSVFVKIIDPWLTASFPKAKIYTTLEGENPGGSIKDHMVKGELEELLKQGKLQAGGEIAEISAGSTAISLAHHAQAYELTCHLFLPETAPESLQDDLRRMKAQIHLVPMETAYERYEEFISKEKIHPFDQMFDESKAKYYQEIGKAFSQQSSVPVDAVIGAVGTGHSLAGVAQGAGANRVISAEPAPGFAVSGVRNIQEQNLGPKDLCLEKFKERIVLGERDFFPNNMVATDMGPVEIGESFQLVLGAVRSFLGTSSESCVFAVGAKNKRKR